MKTRTITIAVITICLGVFFSNFGSAADKLKFGSSMKQSPPFFLPVLAAEEKGFWKENGLEVEWVPFLRAPAYYAAVAARSINIGQVTAQSMMQAATAGLPIQIVSDLHPKDDFALWVRPGSRLREPKDLKGATLGISGFGGIEHAYSRLIVRALGLEKEVKLVATGGSAESIALLKTEKIDGFILSLQRMMNLKISGEVRELLLVENYRPKEWLFVAVSARKDFAQKNPDLVKRTVKAMLQAANFISANPGWTIEKMKSSELASYSEEAAKMTYDSFSFTRDGKISKKALENLRNFLIEFGIIAKEKAPSVEEIYNPEFVR